jgi:hypothetical protein
MSSRKWRMRWVGALVAVSALATTAAPCAAQFLAADDPTAPYDPAPQRLVWPGVAVIIVIALFVTAALAGPLIRINSDQSSDSAPSAPENPE